MYQIMYILNHAQEYSWWEQFVPRLSWMSSHGLLSTAFRQTASVCIRSYIRSCTGILMLEQFGLSRDTHECHQMDSSPMEETNLDSYFMYHIIYKIRHRNNHIGNNMFCPKILMNVIKWTTLHWDQIRLLVHVSDHEQGYSCWEQFILSQECHKCH